MFKIGDKVQIIDDGQMYTTYPIEQLTRDTQILKRYAYGDNNPDITGDFYVVWSFKDKIFISRTNDDSILNKIYLIGADGLKNLTEPVELTMEEIEEKLGYKIKIINSRPSHLGW